jgi:hypothetical protein
MYKRIPVIEGFNQPQEFSSGSARTRGFGGAARKSDPELLADLQKRAHAAGEAAMTVVERRKQEDNGSAP